MIFVVDVSIVYCEKVSYGGHSRELCPRPWRIPLDGALAHSLLFETNIAKFAIRHNRSSCSDLPCCKTCPAFNFQRPDSGISRH